MSGEDRHPCGESPGTVRRSGGDRARRTPATRRGNPAILTRLPIESKSADWPRIRPCSGSISLMDAELTAVRDFLGSYPPYDSLEPAALSALLATMSTVYVRRGTEVIGLGAANDTAYVVRAGAVEIRDTADGLVERAEEGTTFVVSSVRARAGSNYRIVAIEDSLLLTIPGDAFRTLLARPEVGRFFDLQSSARLRAAVLATRVSDSRHAIFGVTVRDMLGREPVTTAPGTPIREVAQVMTRHGVSAILVTEAGRLVGIVTDRDLRRRVVAE